MAGVDVDVKDLMLLLKLKKTMLDQLYICPQLVPQIQAISFGLGI